MAGFCGINVHDDGEACEEVNVSYVVKLSGQRL